MRLPRLPEEKVAQRKSYVVLKREKEQRKRETEKQRESKFSIELEMVRAWILGFKNKDGDCQEPLISLRGMYHSIFTKLSCHYSTRIFCKYIILFFYQPITLFQFIIQNTIIFKLISKQSCLQQKKNMFDTVPPPQYFGGHYIIFFQFYLSIICGFS